MAKCVCSVFVFKVTEPSPLRDSPACAKRAAYPDTPPVVPHPESLAAQAFSEALLPRRACRVAQARIVSRHWDPPQTCYRVPYRE